MQSPPSYVGFAEGGQLTNWVKERPYSVVLIDEVEKAHERILDLFLQILDGARLTDGKGETIDFSETCLIFTSNVGTQDINENDFDKSDRCAVSDSFEKKVEEYFEDMERPELYNRLKRGVVVFNFITAEEAKRVLIDKLKSLANEQNRRLNKSGSQARIDFSEDENDMVVVDGLLQLVNYTKYGLRDVNNVIEMSLGTAIARFLDNPPKNARTLRYRWDNSRNRGIIR